ncbi:MAG: HEAT repeat domain-containing protein, partial [Pirellulales bacterium]|nr:HEAT repeat domain-containing protein [Pirellulales bacterium]
DALGDYDPAAAWIGRLSDGAADVRAQAARALALRHAKGAAVAALAVAVKDPDPTVRRQAALALGRSGEPRAADALWPVLGDDDRFVQFTAMQALRALNRWDRAAEMADTDHDAARRAAIVALTGIYDDGAVAALLKTIGEAQHVDARAAAVAAVAEVHRRADPYTGGWWGTQPARGKPARAKQHEWSATHAVIDGLRAALAQPAPEVRQAAIAAVAAIDDRGSADGLRRVAANDDDDATRIAALDVLAQWQDAEVVGVLRQLAVAPVTTASLRQASVAALARIGTPQAVELLVALAVDQGSPAELLVLCLPALAELKPAGAEAAVTAHLKHPAPEVRAAAAGALARLAGERAVPRLIELLGDADIAVRRSALASLAELRSREAVPALMAVANDPETEFEALTALAALPDERALAAYLRALASKNQTLRDAARTALVQIRARVADQVLALDARHELTSAVLAELDRVYSSPVPVVDWQVLGAWSKESQFEIEHTAAPDLKAQFTVDQQPLAWHSIQTNDEHGRVSLHRFLRPRENCWAWAYAELRSPVAGPTQMLIGSDDQVEVWLNGERVHTFNDNRGWSPDQDRLEVALREGANHLWVKIGNSGGPWEFSVQIGQRDPRFAELARRAQQGIDPSVYRDFALTQPGDAQRGAALFADTKGLACVKCHAVGGGAKAGPDLAGVGAKYAREELIRSVLEPSNRILSGYESSTVATTSGQIVQGVIKQQTDELVELIDAEGRVVRIAADEVDQIERGTLSLMPAGLKDGLTPADFADLIAYLVSLKDQPPAAAKTP